MNPRPLVSRAFLTAHHLYTCATLRGHVFVRSQTFSFSVGRQWEWKVLRSVSTTALGRVWREKSISPPTQQIADPPRWEVHYPAPLELGYFQTSRGRPVWGGLRRPFRRIGRLFETRYALSRLLPVISFQPSRER